MGRVAADGALGFVARSRSTSRYASSLSENLAVVDCVHGLRILLLLRIHLSLKRSGRFAVPGLCRAHVRSRLLALSTIMPYRVLILFGCKIVVRQERLRRDGPREVRRATLTTASSRHQVTIWKITALHLVTRATLAITCLLSLQHNVLSATAIVSRRKQPC